MDPHLIFYEYLMALSSNYIQPYEYIGHCQSDLFIVLPKSMETAISNTLD